MSCEENRGRYLTAVCGSGPAGQAAATALERVFQGERGEPADSLEAADNEAKTRLLFAQFGRCDPPLRPPTHSAEGLPRRDAQRGYARLYDRLSALAGQGALARCADCGQFGVGPGHPTCPKGAQRGAAREPVVPPRAYTYRNQEVQAEVEALPAVDDPAVVAQALAAQQPETVVTAIRGLLRQGALGPAQQLGDRLTTLVSPRLAAIARTQFPTQPEQREELTQALAVQLWQELTDLRPGQEFLCYNLPCVLNRVGATLATQMRRPLQGERQFARSAPGEDAWSEEDQIVASTPPPDAGVGAQEIWAVLGPQERTVAYLLAQGVPVTSYDPEAVTIARVLGVTDRSVRNYRQRAKRQVVAAGLAPPQWLREQDRRASDAA